MKKILGLGLGAFLCVFVSSCGGGSGSQSLAGDDSVVVASVDAGQDISASEGELVVLEATMLNTSEDAEIEWLQIFGPEVEFNQTDTLVTELILPNVRGGDEDVIIRISVNDGDLQMYDDITITIVNLTDGPRGPSSQGVNDDRRDRRRDEHYEDERQVDKRPIRTYDGSQNNRDNPEWGSAFQHLQRLANSDYSDGISSLAGESRASARVISNTVIDQAEDESIPNEFGFSDMVWQWGQFIDHDLDLTDGAEEQADIIVPAGDPWFDPESTGTQIIPFSRALFDPETGTSADNPREQENEISSWLDGSMVYGSDDERAIALRVGADSPYLQTSSNNLLPFNVDSLANANGFATDPTTLFLAGDVRVNEQAGLAVMHTLWVREHNRIARELVEDRSSSDPEVVFQQARRLVIAKLQKITYDEFLPALLGNRAIPKYKGYDSSINPTIFNEFSVAAYRFGHSLINQQLLRLDAQGNEVADGHLSLREAFFTAPSILTSKNSLDPILRGLANQPHQSIDAKVIQDLRNFLFGAPGDGGLDLPSLNIQRGRDHGVPSYNDMRVAMSLEPYSLFSQITSDVDVQTALSEAYAGDIDQIDLWVGGLAEDAVKNSQFGELFQAIILKQFLDLRDGDRFWYENHLTEDELKLVERTTLARVIRANTDIGNEIQDNVFEAPRRKK